MNPIHVSVVVPRPREEVFAWLDVNANHQALLEHMWTDFQFSGPERGVGARLRARAKRFGPEDWSEIEVVASAAPELIVERGSGGGGHRRTQGTYRLVDRGEAETEVNFELEVQQLPRRERLISPLIRIYLNRSMTEAMRRLGTRLDEAVKSPAELQVPRH